MAINFPDSPSVNDTHTVGDKTWTWDGTVWMVTNAVTSLEVIATVALVDADADTKIQLEESADEDKIRFDTAGSERLIIDASGNVGIGTTTPNVVLDIHGNGNSLRLTGTDHVYQEFYADGTVAGRSGYLGYGNATDDNLRINNSITGGDIDFYTENAVRMTIDSAGNVGIGTNSPTSALEVADTNPSTLTLKSKNTVLQVDNEVQAIDFYQSDASGGAGVSARIVGVASNISGAEALTFHTGQAGASASPVAERMRINSNGNVGIGTSSPSTTLHVNGSILANDSVTIGDGGDYVAGSIYSDANWGMIFRAKQASPAQADFRWANSADTERMRIDTSGNVGIGTTAPSDSLTVDDGIIHARSSQSGTTGLGTDKGIALTAFGMNTSSKYTPGVLFGSRDPAFTTTNPKYNAGIYGVATETYGADTDSGMDLEFRITYIDQGTGHGLAQSGGYRMGTLSFYPLTDNQSDLGVSTTSLRWDDIYATSGTVNTSDERDKANIADLDLGLAFVDSLRPVSYTWNDRSGYVGTRTHMGFVAQEVATSLGDEAVNRGLWINSPTVPLDPENPEGEQSVERQGLRYHQLLAPMVKAIQELSATVQTLTARIEALETN